MNGMSSSSNEASPPSPSILRSTHRPFKNQKSTTLTTTSLNNDNSNSNITADPATNATSATTNNPTIMTRTSISRTSEHSQTSTNNNDPCLETNESSSSPSTQQQQQQQQQQQIGSMMAQLSLSTITATLYIPTSAVGAVIGRRGQTIAQLQKTAAQVSSNTKIPVRISVREPETPTYTPLDASDENWTPVVIKADPLAAWSVCEQIQTLIEGGFEQDVIVDIPLHRNKHATVVGKRGWTVATLSADHAVRILVPHKELRHDIVQLEGSLNNVQACFTAMLRVLVAPATLNVPVLPSQTKLRHIGRKTDTILRKTKLEDGTWQLTVTGTGHVPAAMAMLQKWKEELQYPNSKQQQQSQPQQQSVSRKPRGTSKSLVRNNKATIEVSNG